MCINRRAWKRNGRRTNTATYRVRKTQKKDNQNQYQNLQLGKQKKERGKRQLFLGVSAFFFCSDHGIAKIQRFLFKNIQEDFLFSLFFKHALPLGLPFAFCLLVFFRKIITLAGTLPSPISPYDSTPLAQLSLFYEKRGYDERITFSFVSVFLFLFCCLIYTLATKGARVYSQDSGR